MSTVFDVDAIQVDQESPVSLGLAVQELLLSIEQDVTQVVIDTPNTVEVIEIETPGLQGPPGLQNVYVQPNDPSVEFGWGMGEAGYVWIEY